MFHFAKGPDRETDSMVSTWRKNPDRKDWTFHHHVINTLKAYHSELDQPTPVFQKSDKVPYLSTAPVHIWVLYHALWPVAVQYLYRYLTGKDLHPIAAFLFYTVAFKANAIHQVWVLRRLGHKHGFFDGDKHERDDVPDHAVGKVFTSLDLTTTIRPAAAIFMTYAGSSKRLSWWLPIELFLYPIVLDLFFYTYHRAAHETDYLWKYHRTHHLTKHPSPLLSSYADTEQEIIEIALIPFATYAVLKLMGFPMPFFDWWICNSYVLFSEAFGHSGLRVWSTTPGLASPVLRLIGCELALEDHDLHHRKGWKSSYNYGKATRLYDRLFGTCHERIEGHDDNIDYVNRVNFPLY